MRSSALLMSAVLLAATTVGPRYAKAQELASFTCIAPAGHVCQFTVRTGGGRMDFALPSGGTKEAPGLVPHVDTYCVCDPGPVTPDCKQPRLDLWCSGSWSEVQPGVNTQNDIANHRFAIGGSDRAE